jgi:WD40 repeat protein
VAERTPVERTFLRSSLARARRRALVRTVIGSAVLMSLLGLAGAKGIQQRINRANDAQAAVYSRNRALRQSVANDPIASLGHASQLGYNESFTNAQYISDAFSQQEPDDAFKVPSAARRFLTHTIRDQVKVVSGDGRAWQRRSNARSIHIAEQLPRGRPATTATPDAEAASCGGITVRLGRAAGVLDVFRDTRLLRTIYLSRPASAASVSPDQRMIAVAEGNAVDLVDISLAQTRRTLRGGATDIRDVAWSANGNEVWALGPPGLVMMWRVRDGVLVNAPGEHFEAVLPAADPNSVWVVARSGDLSEIGVNTGRRRRLIRVPDTVTSAAASPNGTVAAISGKHGLWIVQLRGANTGSHRRVALAKCSLGRPAFNDAKSFRVPCLGGPVLTVAVASGAVTGTFSVPSGAFAVRFLPRSGVLLVSDQYATLYIVDGGVARPVFRALCGGSISRIAVASDDRTIIPVGAGTGLVGCSSRLTRTRSNEASPGSWHADAVMDDAASAVAQSAAISRAGRVFAYGYNDGTVILHPTENITPAQSVTSVVGAIRDMLVTRDDKLVVVTSAGIVQRITLCETCLSNSALSTVAGKLIRHELAIGVARRVRTNRLPSAP